MEECDNITYRIQYRRNSLTDVDSDNSALFDRTISSLPNTTLNPSQTILELNEKITKLSDDLQIAHHEIENLNSENFRLKSDLQKYLKIVETYKSLNLTENKKLTPRSGRKCKQTRNIDVTPVTKSIQVMAPSARIMNNEATVKSAENTPEAERIPEPINEDCSTQNPKTQPQISKLNMPLNDTKLSPLKKISTPEKDIAPLKKVTTTDVRKDIKHRKLCVLSNSTRRGILQAIEDSFASDFIY
ncbi:unnamed protein product, partial [Parnassius apollo]